jgi:hypothetical protein
LWSALTAAWVLFWLAAVGLVAPGAMLGAANRPTLVPELGPALIWTWLTLAVGVPLMAMVHGFNWVTAILLSMAWPAALWLVRHRGRYESTLRETIRRLVFRAVSPHAGFTRRIELGESGSVMLAMPLLSVMALVRDGTDIRLPVPADFDTLWHTRQLLDDTRTWDPLASLAAVLARLSSADALHVALAVRLGLVMLTGCATALLVAEVCGRKSGLCSCGAEAAEGAETVSHAERAKHAEVFQENENSAGSAISALNPSPRSQMRRRIPTTHYAVVPTAALFVVVAPQAPAHGWAVALVAVVGATSLLRWIRDESSRHGWHALAALLLGAGLLATFSDRLDVLIRVSAAGHYLEHRAAAMEAVRLARSQPDDDWVVAGAPELELEIGQGGAYVDLARFVSRFQHRAHDTSFRFNLFARRLFVFIEKQPVAAREAVRQVRFVDGQPAVYRVRRERARLQRLARRICDEYRRTHSGATIIYDDAELRIYRIDL